MFPNGILTWTPGSKVHYHNLHLDIGDGVKGASRLGRNTPTHGGPYLMKEELHDSKLPTFQNAK